MTSNRSHDAAPRPRRSLFRTTAFTFLLALSAFFGLKGYLGTTPARLPQPQLTAASSSAPVLNTIPIEQIRVGQRVLTKGEAPDKTLETAVDQHTWRHLTLQQTETWPDGTVDRISVEALLPPEWLIENGGASVGTTVPMPLDLAELQLPEDMTGVITANEPCPPISSGPGRVVLTTINHLNRAVFELTLTTGDGTQETLRPTVLHRFYSETRDDWVSTGDLQIGERLRSLAGPLQVVSLASITGTHRVYNMSVEGEHVYHVSALGVLTHNNYDPNYYRAPFGGPYKWHYTDRSPEQMLGHKLRRGSWVTDNPHLTAEQVKRLGVKVPPKYRYPVHTVDERKTLLNFNDPDLPANQWQTREPLDLGPELPGPPLPPNWEDL